MFRATIILAALGAAIAIPASADAAVGTTITDGTLTVTGDAAADQITLTGTRASLDVVAGVQRSTFSRSRFSRVVVRSGAGGDTVRVDPQAALADLTIETGAGADTVLGSNGVEVIDSGDDADLVRPGGGDDLVALGAGDDRAVQTADATLDRIDGGLGLDRLNVVGTSDSEEFTVQAVGNRARISRDTSAALAELAAVEIADVSAGDGADLVDVGSLAGSGLQRVDADLGAGDGARDQVTAQGSGGNEHLDARRNGDDVAVSGLPGGASVNVENSRAGEDRLTLFGAGGRDSITAHTLAGIIDLTLDGGAGGDTLTGGAAADILRGGEDTDVAFGGEGDDAIDLGAGDDFAGWNDGDGNDVVEGGAGTDSLSVRGIPTSDTVGVAADGARLRVTRSAGAAAVSAGDVEKVDADLFGGADRLNVGDLTGTVVTAIDADLGADSLTDEVTVNGTAADDKVEVSGGIVRGLAARTTITSADLRDKLVLNGLGGGDTLDSTAVPATGIRIQADGGDGDDFLLGGDGDDVQIGGAGADVGFAGSGDNVVLGGAGDDVLRGEEGDDVLDGGPDDDVLIGNAGDDVLLNGEVVFDD